VRFGLPDATVQGILNQKQNQERGNAMNLRRGFRRITLVLAIIGGILGAIVGVSGTAAEHDYAQRRLRWEEENYINKYGHLPPPEAFVIDEPKKEGEHWKKSLNRVKKEVATEELRKLRDGFWVKLPKVGLIGLCTLAGIAGAAIGFLGTWVVIWFGGLAVYKLIKWLVLGFREDTG